MKSGMKRKHMKEWGLTENITNIWGNKIVTYNLPVRPGRNIAVIVETAAVNHRQEQMGYNTAQRLYEKKITKQQLERDLEEDEDEDVVDNFVDNWEKLIKRLI